MNHLAVGVDLVAINRIAALLAEHGERFTRRVFTERERADCAGRPDSLAARWAAKEAIAKALGTGFGPIGFQDIEVVRDEAGCPHVQLHGGAAALARSRELHRWALSLAHDGGMAIAFVVASS
ncbi:MAG: holo-ACP synthase [Anaerolineae bacterium]|nr:holo-ACP synthase [Anaerolineae bacterium]